MTRKFLRSVCVGLLGMLLFAQMAIAAYACPGLSPAGIMDVQVMSPPSWDIRASNPSTSPAGDRLTNCDDMAGEMAPASTNLCAEHCRFGQQSNQTPTLAVPAVLLNERYTTPLLTRPADPPRPAASETSALTASSPPRTILHCCFRL